MMVEWRIFYPLLEQNPLNIWALLHSRNLFCFKDSRRDIYVACTEEVGLKLRGKKLAMEVKVKGQQYPCGGEEWEKVNGPLYPLLAVLNDFSRFLEVPVHIT